MHEQIRAIMSELSKLSSFALTIHDDDDLWDAGMDSLTSVQLLLRLEEHFEVEIPEDALTRDTFRTIKAMSDVLLAQLETKGSPAS
jgi:acyl carrier protein